MNSIATALELQRSSGNYRMLKAGDGLVDFSSNDYLGLSQCPRIRARLQEALANGCPLGATGSRLLSGQTVIHAQVENFFEEIFEVPSVLLFSSGYMANMGVLSAFASLGAAFFSDELNHASLVDGMRLGRCEKNIFEHNNLQDLEKKLCASDSPLKVIVTESVFSMDGDLAPLDELMELSLRFDAWLVVDEAHATGVFGKSGLGRLEEIKSGEKIISIHTGGKALGGQGAFVISSKIFRELLINKSRSFIFSTALAPLMALQLKFAMEEVLANPARGALLLKKASAWRKSLPQELLVKNSHSQIIPILMLSNERALKVASGLQESGFDVRAIRSPTVALGQERLRITIQAKHSEPELSNLHKELLRISA